jgi:hypothetical protein
LAVGSCANAKEKHKETLIRNTLPTRLNNKNSTIAVHDITFLRIANHWNN